MFLSFTNLGPGKKKKLNSKSPVDGSICQALPFLNKSSRFWEKWIKCCKGRAMAKPMEISQQKTCETSHEVDFQFLLLFHQIWGIKRHHRSIQDTALTTLGTIALSLTCTAAAISPYLGGWPFGSSEMEGHGAPTVDGSEIPKQPPGMYKTL